TTTIRASEPWRNNIAALYKLLDDEIQRLINALDPKHLVISSDHGNGSAPEYMNPNAFLQETGFQPTSVNLKATTRRSLRAIASGRIPAIVKKVDWNHTRAFSNGNRAAIFANDRNRFGGPVADNELPELCKEICSIFNKHPDAQARGITAKPYRERFKGSRYYDFLPDVQLVSDQALFQVKQGPFFSDNPLYGPIPNLKNINRGMVSGNKTRYPLFACDPDTAKLIRDSDPRDLTLVHKLTQRIFSK
ncbi:MAG: alkaline phosphatase family protein, partial [Rhodopirellula sp. JB053]